MCYTNKGIIIIIKVYHLDVEQIQEIICHVMVDHYPYLSALVLQVTLFLTFLSVR